MPRPKKQPDPAPAPPPADDFDQDTPPPRTRPRGDRLPAHVVLILGEDVPAVFLAWDAQGRVPPGSVLCEFVGTACGTRGHSGYKVAAIPPAGNAALGRVGAEIPARGPVDDYRISHVVVPRLPKEQGQRLPSHVVMSPHTKR